MPRKPKAMSPKAKMSGTMSSAPAPIGNMLLIHAPTPIRPAMVMPIQYALKSPAMRPARMVSDAPPSREAVTTSRTWRDSVEVKTFTSSGMIAPASVPQVMIVESFHHIVASPPSVGMSRYETAYVTPTDRIEVIQTSDVSGASKFMTLAALYLAAAMAPLSQ